jgi:hypothetical protein
MKYAVSAVFSKQISYEQKRYSLRMGIVEAHSNAEAEGVFLREIIKFFPELKDFTIDIAPISIKLTTP